MRVLLFLSTLLLASGRAAAFSQGSPICEVNFLPLLEMSNSLLSPPPTGWRLELEDDSYFPGSPLAVRVVNDDPTREANGVLLWAQFRPAVGAGRFMLPPGERFQHVPPSPIAACDEWAITHRDGLPKPQALLTFEWLPPEAGAVIFRAFVIERCDAPEGCRGAQALTPVELLLPGIFRSGFEN